MNPVAIRVAVGLVRHALQWLSGYLIAEGVVSAEDWNEVILWIALSVLTAASYVWGQWRASRKASRETPPASPGGSLGLGLVLVAALSASACASAGGLVATNPTGDQVAAIHRDASKMTEGITIATQILEALSETIDVLPIPIEAKNTYDCGVLRVIGTPAPIDPTVARICGPTVVEIERSPMTDARESLASAASCPSLRSSVAAIEPLVDPLIEVLEDADNGALVAFGASVRIALGFVFSGGDVCQ